MLKSFLNVCVYFLICVYVLYIYNLLKITTKNGSFLVTEEKVK